MSVALFNVLHPGLGATFQDQGRRGWRRFGVPPSGAMDEHAAMWANRLLDNPLGAPVLELLFQGAKLAVLRDAWLAITGADAQANLPTWRTVHAKADEVIQFPKNRSGVWIYIAVEGGFEGERLLGSASVYQRARLGRGFVSGEVLSKISGARYELPRGVAGRSVI